MALKAPVDQRRSAWARTGRPQAPLLVEALKLFVLVILVSCEGIDTSAHLDLERMQVQPRFRPYGESSFFEDQRMMRAPPTGTVPVENHSPATVATIDGAMVDSIYRERIPIPVTTALVQRGQRHFETVCAPCHGLLGDGDSFVAPHMSLRRPPSLLSDEMRARPVGRLYRAIEDGYGLMPSYASLLSPEERWAVVAYVQALQLSQRIPLEELPPSIAAEAQRALNTTVVQ